MNIKAAVLVFTLLLGGFNIHNSDAYLKSAVMSKVRIMEVDVHTDSDWTHLDISGLGSVIYRDHMVTEGVADVDVTDARV